MWTSRKVKAEDVTPSIKTLNELTKEDRLTVAYIKLKELLTPEQDVIIYDEYLLVVNTSFTQADFAYKDKEIVINLAASNNVVTQVNLFVGRLEVLFNQDINVITDIFIIDNASKSIYIGKAAHDFMTAERILH